MSKTAKCPICATTEQERCILMRVQVDAKGKKSYYCCERTPKGKNKEI